jgi:hypothetical protein
MQPTGQGPGDESGPLLTFEKFVEGRLFSAWFPTTQPVGEDLANWLEIAAFDTEVFIQAMKDFLTLWDNSRNEQ